MYRLGIYSYIIMRADACGAADGAAPRRDGRATRGRRRRGRRVDRDDDDGAPACAYPAWQRGTRQLETMGRWIPRMEHTRLLRWAQPAPAACKPR